MGRLSLDGLGARGFGILPAPFFQGLHGRLHVLGIRGDFQLSGFGDFASFLLKFPSFRDFGFSLCRYGLRGRLGVRNRYGRLVRFRLLRRKFVRRSLDDAPMDGVAFFRSHGIFGFSNLFLRHLRNGFRLFFTFRRLTGIHRRTSCDAERHGAGSPQKDDPARTVLPKFLPFAHEGRADFGTLRIRFRNRGFLPRLFYRRLGGAFRRKSAPGFRGGDLVRKGRFYRFRGRRRGRWGLICTWGIHAVFLRIRLRQY